MGNKGCGCSGSMLRIIECREITETGKEIPYAAIAVDISGNRRN